MKTIVTCIGIALLVCLAPYIAIWAWEWVYYLAGFPFTWVLLFASLQAAIVFFTIRGQKMSDAQLDKVIHLLERQIRLLNDVREALKPGDRAHVVEFYKLINGQREKVDNMFMKIEGVADLAVAFKDAKGNPAKVDGVPQWALTNEALGKLEVSEDGMSAVFTAASDLQAGKIQLKADADMGEGIKEIVGELDVELSPLDAEFVEITATVRP